MKITITLAAALLSAFAALGARAAEPLKVCATIPDLGSLATAVGGDEVKVTVFAKGPQDPHVLEARPSFIKELSTADLLILVGLGPELLFGEVLDAGRGMHLEVKGERRGGLALGKEVELPARLLAALEALDPRGRVEAERQPAIAPHLGHACLLLALAMGHGRRVLAAGRRGLRRCLAVR